MIAALAIATATSRHTPQPTEETKPVNPEIKHFILSHAICRPDGLLEIPSAVFILATQMTPKPKRPAPD